VSAIQVRGVPTELHERLRRRAEADNVSLSTYVLQLLERDAGRPSTGEWLHSLTRRERVPDADVTAFLGAERRQREQQFSRALRH